MPWYLISWFDSTGEPLRRDLIERLTDEKIWAYIQGRIDGRRLPKYAQAVHFDNAPESLIYDWDNDRPAEPSLFPIEVPEMLLSQHNFPHYPGAS
jgi:acetylornithine deacetylase/succinyl-diaminopimelate desuccinylase-like protein